MPGLRASIQNLLFLEKPLPRSITDELRLGYRPLLRLHDKFAEISSDLRIWTFYETVDSQLSGLANSEYDEVHFSAPITSIKSGLIGNRKEIALSLESDHAHCASFGPQNLQIMHSYLCDLGAAVRKAEELSSRFVHTPLRLTKKVKVELIGFYDDEDSDADRSIRLYVSKHFLNEFLEKGPEECLRERLNTMAAKPRRTTFPRARRIGASPSRTSGALGIWGNMQELGQRILGSSHSGDTPQGPDIPSKTSPEIVVTSHTPRRPSLTGTSSEPFPAVNVAPTRSRGLTVPSLATPLFGQPSGRGSSESGRSDNIDEAASTRSRSVAPDNVSPMVLDADENDQAAEGRAHVEDEKNNVSRKSRKDQFSRTSALQDFTAGFSRPNPTKRKFMWIHLPFNNPQWVKVTNTPKPMHT